MGTLPESKLTRRMREAVERSGVYPPIDLDALNETLLTPTYRPSDITRREAPERSAQRRSFDIGPRVVALTAGAAAVAGTVALILQGLD